MLEKDFFEVYVASMPNAWNRSDTVNLTAGVEKKLSSRALRLVDDPKRFLFVKVARKHSDVMVRQFLVDAWKHGIRIKGVSGTYDFLGFTESSIKSGHAIFFRGDSSWAVDTLLKEFGELDSVFQESGPGKYAARLGLSFSATIKCIKAPSNKLTIILDVSANDGVLTTDGCGIIRESFAEKIREEHGLETNTSVFQIRRGGIKGILVAYPDEIFHSICTQNAARPTARRRRRKLVIAYRPSMRKYYGGPTDLELNNISEPAGSARLNYSIVVLLLSLGVPIKAFDDLLKAQLRSIGVIAHDRQEALRYIKGDLDAKGNAFFQELFEMVYAGHSMDEPYVRDKLRSYQKLQYNNLKRKLNIRVPKSCYVYGVVDELGILRDGEVYLNLPHREGAVTAEVLVARNPSYKPSDIRKLTAVDRPRLSFLTNCIVFPRSGEFSIPGSMSGGDLDGDMYLVSWEPTLLPRKTEMQTNENPMPLGRNTPISRQHSDIHEAQIDVFVNLRRNKLIGMIANEWYEVVEIYRSLAAAQYPRRLAGLIEVALDMLKNGTDPQRLREQFNFLRYRYGTQVQYIGIQPPRISQPERLRALIPDLNEVIPNEAGKWKLDPQLDVRSGHTQEWNRHYEEGKRVIKTFNRNLAVAIEKDEEEAEDDPSRTTWQKDEIELSHADRVKETYLDKYFPASPGFLSARNLESYLRASAWYAVGYEAGRPAFAWLGTRFLNQIKAHETNGGRPGFAIGALRQLTAEEERERAQGDIINTNTRELALINIVV